MIENILGGGLLSLSLSAECGCGCSCQCSVPGSGYSDGYYRGTRDGAREKAGGEEQL